MLQRLNGRPGDERGFIHKSKFGKFVRGAVGTVAGNIPGIGTAITAANLARRAITSRPTLPRTTTARVTRFSEAEKDLGKNIKFGGGGFRPGRRGFAGGGGNGDLRSGPCDFPMVRDSQGRCRTPTSGEFGGEQFGVGEAVMGRYGAALEPGSQIIDRAICLRGMQLGDDGLCYNKSQITNKQRMWPAGRRPLLTGGDMRAISTAARAGRRMDLATKRLQKLGMMKKPTGRGRRAPHAHARAATNVVSV